MRIVTLGLLTCTLWLAAMTLGIHNAWDNIPHTIPTHFNIHGEADKMGTKNTILLVLGTAWVFAIGGFLSLKTPRGLINLPSKIPAEKLPNAYEIARQGGAWIFMTSCLLMTHLSSTLSQSSNQLGPLFLLFSLAVLTAVAVVLFRLFQLR